MLSRIEPPSRPMCYENAKYKIAIEQIFSIFSKYLGNDSSSQRVHVSGGCLMKTYNNSDMCDDHKKSFGDIDWKISKCSDQEIANIISYVELYINNDGDISSEDSAIYEKSPLIKAIKELIILGDELESIYSNNKKTLIAGQLKERKQTVIKMRWYSNVAIDIVMFQESITEHLLGTDISTTAGYFNPLMNAVCFPCDSFPEVNSSGLVARANRSAKDFHNREINMLFPKQFESMIDCDPTRIFHIIWTANSSDFSLSNELIDNIIDYVHKKKGSVFNKLKAAQLYNNLKLMFFKGFAVKNFAMLNKLGLIDELLIKTNKSVQTNELAMYLLQKVATTSDNDYSLWPSILPYAIYWDEIKNRSFSPYLIQELSNGKLSIYFKRPSKYNLEKIIHRDDLNESIHEENIALLKSWEADYQSKIINSIIKSAIDAAMTTTNDIQSKMIIRSILRSTVELVQKNALLEESQELSAIVADTSITEAIKQVSIRACIENFASSTNKVDSKETIELAIVHCTNLIEQDAYRAYCQRGNLYMRLEKYKNAKNDFILAIKHNKVHAEAFYFLGNVEIKLAKNYDSQISSAQAKKKLRPANTKFEDDCKRYSDLQNEHYYMAASYYELALSRNPMYHAAKFALHSISAAINGKTPKNDKPYSIKQQTPFKSLREGKLKESIAVSSSTKDYIVDLSSSEKNESIFAEKKYEDLSSRYERAIKKLIELQKLDFIDRLELITEFDEIILQCSKYNKDDFFILQAQALLSKGQCLQDAFMNYLLNNVDINLADQYAKDAIDTYNKIKEMLKKFKSYNEINNNLLQLVAWALAKINLEKAKFYFKNVAQTPETKKQEKRRLAKGKEKLDIAEIHYLEVINYCDNSQAYKFLGEIETIRAKYIAKDIAEQEYFMHKAKENYLENQSIFPESIEAYIDLGNLDMLSGNFQESILYYKISLNLLIQESESYSKQKQYVIFSKWANAIVSEKQIAENGTDRFFSIQPQAPLDEKFKTLLIIAREGYLEALKCSSDTYDNFYYTLIIIDLLIENHNYAISDIERVLSTHDERSVFTKRALLLLYAMAYEMSGDISNAKKYYIQAATSSKFPDDSGGESKFINVAKHKYRKILTLQLNCPKIPSQQAAIQNDDEKIEAKNSELAGAQKLMSISIFNKKPSADESEFKGLGSDCSL